MGNPWTALSTVEDAAENVQYLFLEGLHGFLEMFSSTAAPPGSEMGHLLSFGPVDGGMLASYLLDGSPVVVQQFNGTELKAQRIARQGSVLGNGTLVA